MPSLSDLRQLVPLAAPVVQGLVQRGATNNAVNTLSTGADAAMGTINSGAQRAQRTLDSTIADSRGLLQPYQDAGTDALGTLQEGMKPGGGLLDPFSAELADLYKDPSFQFRLKNGLAAIDAEGNATGTHFSGATLKTANDYAGQSASQEWAAENARYRQNQQDRINAQMGLVNLGAGEANQGVAANQGYSTNTVNLQTGTAKSIADLQTDKASAIAAGDIAKANSIDAVIKSLTDQVGRLNLSSGANVPAPGPQPGDPNFVGPVQPSSPVPGDPNFYGPVQPASPQPGDPNFYGPTQPDSTESGNFQNLPGSLGEYAGSIGSLAGGAALAGGAGGAAAAAPAVSVAIPELGIGVGGAAAGGAGLAGAGAAGGGALAGTGALAGPEIAAPALAPGAAGGLGPAIAGFLTNPITIGVGAALAAAIIWKRSQAHPTADKWVQGYQNKFDQHMAAIDQQFRTAAQSGQLTKEQAQQIRDQAAGFAADYEKSRQEFSTKGKKERTVAAQALNTENQWYGPNFSGYLGKMDAIIQGLQ